MRFFARGRTARSFSNKRQGNAAPACGNFQPAVTRAHLPTSYRPTSSLATRSHYTFTWHHKPSRRKMKPLSQRTSWKALPCRHPIGRLSLHFLTSPRVAKTDILFQPLESRFKSRFVGTRRETLDVLEHFLCVRMTPGTQNIIGISLLAFCK